MQLGYTQEVYLPLYEYECEKCGEHLEKIQKFSDAPLTTCPKCGGHLERLISSPAIQFKGTGWYVTDYARKGFSPAGSKDSTTADNGGKKSAAKSETAKPAEKK